MEDLLKKLDMFISETYIKGEDVKGVRPIQFLNWWGDFRPGDRVDVMFGEDYISLAGTNAEGNFAGIKKEMEIDEPADIDEFKSIQGRVWTFV
jgi:hypothetical protein